MSTYRPQAGAHGGALCPVCSYPHFPFCGMHPSNLSSLPPTIDARPIQAGRPGHISAQPPLHPRLPAPSPMALHDRSLLQRQSLNGSGLGSEAIPNGILPAGRVGYMVQPFPNPGGPVTDGASGPDPILRPPPFLNPFAKPYQNPIAQSFPRSSLNSGHGEQSVAQLPFSSNSAAVGPPYVGHPYSGPRANEWADENTRNSHAGGSLPPMPQWFVDQQRRSGSKDATMFGRIGVGEMLRRDEMAAGQHFGMAAPELREKIEGVERDLQGRYLNSERQEPSGIGLWPNESVPLPRSRPFDRSDTSGGSAIGDTSVLRPAQLANGHLRLPDNFAGNRERQLWDVPRMPGRDAHFELGSNSRSGHLWGQSPSERPQLSTKAGYLQNAGNMGHAYHRVESDDVAMPRLSNATEMHRESYGRSIFDYVDPGQDPGRSSDVGFPRRSLGMPERYSQHHSDPVHRHGQQNVQGLRHQSSQLQIQSDQPAQVQPSQHQPIQNGTPLPQMQPPLPVPSHLPALSLTPNALTQHHPQHGHTNSTQLPGFYSNSQETREPLVGNRDGLANSTSIYPETLRAAAVTDAPQEHVLDIEGPPIPTHPASVLPYPPASLPGLPPPQSPPMAPPPPPSPPPPTPPPPVDGNTSGLAFVPVPGSQPRFAEHLPVLEDPINRFQYGLMKSSLKPPPHAIPQPPPLQQPMNPWYVHHKPFGTLGSGDQIFPPHQDKPKVVDAVSIFRRPGRVSRPDRIVIILRGLPGSGKSHLVKGLRDVELMNGGSAPRIHSIDDYFMAEVEKVDGDEVGAKLLSNGRMKKGVVEKVMEYCYEAEMEQVYRGSMLKAFKKTVEEGMFSFIIVDDRNVLVADFAQFWAIAKRSGYEVYLLESPYKDPEGCARRNVHRFTHDEIQSMARRWEPAPPMYLQLDVASLFRGDDLNSQDITEVEMDADDMECEADDKEEEFEAVTRNTSQSENKRKTSSWIDAKAGNTGDRWEDSDGEGEDNTVKFAKRLRFNADSKRNKESSTSSSDQSPVNNALSGLMEAYGKREKSVRWADHQMTEDDRGFSITSTLERISDLVMGPGPGYNKVSNPVQDDEKSLIGTEHMKNNRRSRLFEQYRAEQDTFRAVLASQRDQSREDSDD